MTPNELSEALRAALAAKIADGTLALDLAALPEQILVERPRQREHGDWSTNIALQLAKKAGTQPRALADDLAVRVAQTPGIKSVDVAGPGFLNITLDAAAAGELARTIIDQGAAYGRGDAEAGKKDQPRVRLRQPDGPSTSAASAGPLSATRSPASSRPPGAVVTREYYFNDHGAQIDRFARSLLARAKGEDAPEDGYGGQYIQDIADAVLADVAAAGEPTPRPAPTTRRRRSSARSASTACSTRSRRALHGFGVDFDVYFHEDTLHESGAVDRAIARLKESGHMFEADGATWLRTTDFGDDKDRVVIKSDGQAAYIAGDIAYYLDKRERGANEVIIMLGADHHGYVGRMMAVCAAFGDEPGTNLQILIGQMVNLLKDGQPLRMSKRAGTVVTLEDLVDAVGVDAARYSLVRSSTDSSLDIDLDLLSKATNENPVYYVQYAHARTANVARNAADHGVRREDAFDPSLLTAETESALLGSLTEFPRVIAQAAELREPHRVARYLEALAGAYHSGTRTSASPRSATRRSATLHRTRLWLNDATRQVLANGLALLGVSAPERM